jgi:uncharacterized protein (PEP-CTERM system associated)
VRLLPGLLPGLIPGLWLAAGLGQAQAQPMRGDGAASGPLHVEASVATDTTATTNVGLDGPGAVRSDLILSVSPLLRVNGGGAGWRLDGQAGLTAQFYADHSRRDRLLPRIDLNLGTQVLDRWLSIDSRLVVAAEKANPFGGGSVVDVDSLQINSQLQLSPTLDHEFSPGQRLRMRSDNTWLHQSGDNQGTPSVASSVQRHTAAYSLEPRPIGWRLEASRMDSRNRDLSDPVLRHDSLRAIAAYALDAQLSLQLHGGRDHAVYGINQRSGTIEGLGLFWVPDERSRLEAHAERHFYGLGWQVQASHRGPGLSINVDGQRDIGSYAAALGSLLPGGSVADLLDRMLAGRITDAAQRAAAVQDLITRRGLPGTLSRPTELFSSRAEVRTTANLSVGLIGVRHVLTLHVHSLHTQDLPGDQLLTGAISGDARQNGWDLGLNRKLDPQTSADLSLGRNRNVGLGLINEGRETHETSVRLGLTHELTARTVVSGGLRRVLLKSTTLGDANETAVFAGALHRF